MGLNSNDLSKPFVFWVLANILGSSASAVVSVMFVSLLPPKISSFASVIFLSIPIGLAQWLSLRRNTRTSFLWIFTFTAGFLLFMLINRVVMNRLTQLVDDESAAILTLEFIMMGFIVGLLQWLILQRHFSGAALWILGSTAGVGFTFWLILTTNLINLSGLVSVIVGILGYSFITGVTLVKLLAQQKRMKEIIA
jgi:hypothetical protein